MILEDEFQVMCYHSREITYRIMFLAESYLSLVAQPDAHHHNRLADGEGKYMKS